MQRVSHDEFVVQFVVDKEAPTSVYWPIFMTQLDGHAEWGVRRNVAFAIRTGRAGSESLGASAK